MIPAGGVELDAISWTWLRGLISTALELRLRPLCWHISHDESGATATGYVSVSLQHEAREIRSAWADALGLSEVRDSWGAHNGYSGRAGALTITLPAGIDPDEHCRICGQPFDPRGAIPERSRHQGGDVCRSCTGDTPA